MRGRKEVNLMAIERPRPARSIIEGVLQNKEAAPRIGKAALPKGRRGKQGRPQGQGLSLEFGHFPGVEKLSKAIDAAARRIWRSGRFQRPFPKGFSPGLPRPGFQCKL